jgi:hypothetical protein
VLNIMSTVPYSIENFICKTDLCVEQ